VTVLWISTGFITFSCPVWFRSLIPGIIVYVRLPANKVNFVEDVWLNVLHMNILAGSLGQA